MDATRQEASVDVAGTPEQVWDALTNPELTRRYYYGTDILSDWKPGSRWTSESDGELYLEGELLEVDAPNRIVQTFHIASEEPAALFCPTAAHRAAEEPRGQREKRERHAAVG